MAAASNEANFRINIEGNASDATKDISRNARLAATAIGIYEEEIKTLSGDMRRLRGNSDEVNAAKKALRDQIEKARTSVSGLTVDLNKQGTSYAAAAKAAKQYGTGVGGIGGAAREAMGKIGGLASKAAGPLGKALAKVGGPAAKKLGAALAPAAKKIGGALAPAMKKVKGAIAPAAKVIGRFGQGAGRALGGIAKVARPLAEKTLPSLSSAISLAGAGAMTATVAIAAAGVAAVGAAAGVMGLAIASADSAQKLNRQRQALLGNAEDAKKLGDQITLLAGKVPQGVEELHNLSVELSKTKLSSKAIVSTMNAVAQATGAVDASAGAKIQEIITRGQQMGRMGLNQLELQGTGLEFDDVAKAYAEGTRKSVAAAREELRTGSASLEDGAEAMRKATEKKFGGLNIANAFSLENGPKKFFEGFKALTAGIKLEPLTKALQGAFGQLSPDAPLGRAVKTFFETTGSDLISIAAKSIPVLLEGFKWLMVGALRVGAFFYEMKRNVQDAFAADSWMGVGKAIVEGILKGIKGQQKFAIESIMSLGGSIKRAFTGELDIESPSKVFEKYGAHTVEGYAQGVERGSERAQGAVTGMVQTPNAPKGGQGGGAATIGPITVNITAPAGGAEAMQSPMFLENLTRALRDAMTSAGVAA